MAQKPRPEVTPVDLHERYAIFDNAEARLLADAEYRRSTMPNANNAQQQWARKHRGPAPADSPVVSGPVQPATKKPTLAEQLDAMSEDKFSKLEDAFFAARERRTFGDLSPEEQAADNEQALEEADLEYHGQAGAGMIEEPDDYPQ